MKIAVRVDITEPGSDWLIDEQQIGEFVPGTLIIGQGFIVLQAIRTDLHQRAVHGTTSGTTVQPDHSSLAVGNMAILVVPEEKISIVLWIQLNMAAREGNKSVYRC